MILFKWNLASQNPQIFPFSIQFRDGTKNFYEIVKKIPCFLPTWSPFLSYLCCMTNAKLVFMKNKTLWKSQEILCVHLHIMQYLYSGLENKKMCNLWKLFNSKGKVRRLRHILRCLHSLDILFRQIRTFISVHVAFVLGLKTL